MMEYATYGSTISAGLICLIFGSKYDEINPVGAFLLICGLAWMAFSYSFGEG
jgi:hypothetical protein